MNFNWLSQVKRFFIMRFQGMDTFKYGLIWKGTKNWWLKASDLILLRTIFTWNQLMNNQFYQQNSSTSRYLCPILKRLFQLKWQWLRHNTISHWYSMFPIEQYESHIEFKWISKKPEQPQPILFSKKLIFKRVYTTNRSLDLESLKTLDWYCAECHCYNFKCEKNSWSTTIHKRYVEVSNEFSWKISKAKISILPLL